MSKALEGEHLCVKHQGNHSHYAENNCTICKLESQLSASEEARQELLTAFNRANGNDTHMGEPVIANDMKDAYVGAREDLLMWKNRALVAEKARKQLEAELAEWKLSHASVTRLLAENSQHFFHNKAAVSRLSDVILLLEGKEQRPMPPQGEY